MSTAEQPGRRRKARPAPPPVGRVRGPDGAERDVYEDADGRQYVLGAQGEKVYGLWLLTAPPRPPAPPDEPAAKDEPAPEGPLEDVIAAPEDEPPEPGVVRRDRERHRGKMLSLLGMIALCVGVMALPAGPLGVPGLVLGLLVRSAARRDLKKIEEGTMDPEGAQLTRAALSDATVGTWLSGAGLIFGSLVITGLLFYLT
jgi:hypothetical protein